MGCKQTKIEPPVAVITMSSPTSTYVRSSMKKSHLNAKGKTEKLSFIKRKTPGTNKSVNFDEKVQVKSRTPTPKETQYEKPSLTKIYRRQVPTDDDDDDDDGQTSSISSLDEEIQNDRRSGPSSSTLQRNGHWQKQNSIGVTRPTNGNKENIQQSSVNRTSHATDDLVVSPGNRFRVRRKVRYSVLSPSSTADALISSTSTPTHRSVVQPSLLPVQRSLPNTKAILLEHRGSVSNGESSPKATYYAFSRRPIDNTTFPDK